MLVNNKGPTVTGKTVSLYSWPMMVPILTEINDDVAPITAAPVPAICPIGAMAKVFKLPKIKPKLLNKIAIYSKNIQSLTSTRFCIIRKTNDVTITTPSARDARYCIPSLSTKREFINDDVPNTNAKEPKYKPNNLPVLNSS